MKNYSSNINSGKQKVGNSVEKTINIIFKQLQEVVNKDGFNIINPQQYFNVVIVDKNNCQLNSNAIFLTEDEYWYEIRVTNFGAKYFIGKI